jgi:DNA ligase-associated metallophosphoesterase
VEPSLFVADDPTEPPAALASATPASGGPGIGMGTPALALGGEALALDPSGALVFADRGMVVIADLHLEKGSAFARCGHLLPPYDTRRSLDLLERVLGRVRPRTVVSLGDGFHDPGGAGRLAADDRARLASLVARHDWLWVLGNHDPAPPEGLGGRSEPALQVGRVVLRHQPEATPGWSGVAGHLHPVARLHRRARSVTRPCFVSDGARLLLPAFGAYTGGLDVREAAIRHLFPSGCAAWLLGRRTVHRVPVDRLGA